MSVRVARPNVVVAFMASRESNRTVSRRELFDLVWSRPTTTVATELETSGYHLAALCRRLALPLPRAGHWMKAAVGRAPAAPPFPAEPVLDDERHPIPQPGSAKPASPRRSRARLRPPARVAADASRSLTATTPEHEEKAPRPPDGQEPAPPVEPGPTRLDRDELHRLIWSVPIARLAVRFGISGVGLAKVCARLSVPRPPRGHWSKLAAGKPSPIIPLGPAARGTPGFASVGRAAFDDPAADERDAGTRIVAAARARLSAFTVAKQLSAPHPLVAEWIARHERLVAEKKRDRKLFGSGFPPPPPLDAFDHRCHRIFDAIFKALGREDVGLEEKERGRIIAKRDGEQIEIAWRQRLKQVRRPLTEDKKRWSYMRERAWVRELHPTGELVVEIRTWLPPGFGRLWRESPAAPMETTASNIVATVVAAFPLLVERARLRREAEANAAIARAERRRAQLEREEEEARWRRIVDFAKDWEDIKRVAALLAALDEQPFDRARLVGGVRLGDWLNWARDQAQRRAAASSSVEQFARRAAGGPDAHECGDD